MVYLPYIVKALEKFYLHDKFLIESSKPPQHEDTFTFRLADYIKDEVEGLNNGMDIDCQYRRMMVSSSVADNKTVRRNGKDVVIRPDIIYHKRGTNLCNKNGFIIEVKRGASNGDIRKVCDEVYSLKYGVGFCLYGFNKDTVNVAVIEIEKEINQQQRIANIYKYKYTIGCGLTKVSTRIYKLKN
ncbi:hypothetical protein FACS189443_0450 [Planctomycetales bacterium]|nr:hypothetical protein FACS189443_0450 [Planctomycetales bacterium]